MKHSGQTWTTLALALMLAAGAAGLLGSAPASDPLVVPQAAKPPVIDGVLDDEAWALALKVSEFMTFQPDYGRPPSQKSEGFLTYDADNFYFAMRCFDTEPDKIKAAISKRDAIFGDDYAAFLIDTFNDSQSAFGFCVNPLGIQGDGMLDIIDIRISNAIYWRHSKRSVSMRPRGSPKSLEERRRKVVTFLKQKLSLHEIARRMGCHASSVLRWRNAVRAGGLDALKANPAPGRPPRLTARQKERLVHLLTKGAMTHGYRTDLWTTQRIADLIERRLGVRYHRNHVGKLLHRMGWSHQKPERRAVERDETAIAEWKRSVWPRVKKTPPGWQPISSLSTNRASS